jgi:hypothetical protein
MFSKSFRQQFDSSIAEDPMRRVIFNDMCILADRHGVVDMTYGAIAAVTRWPIETVIAKIGELMEADPESRSKKCNGARLVLIDSDRNWGWRIVNYEHYRNLRDTEGRNAYMRDLMKNKRRKEKEQRLSTGKHPLAPVSRVSSEKGTCPRKSAEVRGVSTEGCTPEQEPDLPSGNDKHPLAPVSTGKQLLAHAEAEAYIPPTVPLEGGQRDLDFQQAKVFLHSLFGRAKRKWSYEEEQLLFDITPIHAPDVQLIRIWFTLPEEHPVFQKTKRKQELTTFLRDFNGELDKIRKYAPDFGAKRRLADHPEKKPDPPRWQEFFKWLYDAGVRLPASFYELGEDLQQKYWKRFGEFELRTIVS